jgi:predicted cupin superfamily sugar epimerase
VVTVANSSLLDFESATSHTITVRATSSDGSFSTTNYTISLTDVDEFDVGAISDTNAAANSLAENSANGTAVGITASASDADATNNTITYSLDDSAGGRFAINSSTGVVTVANSSLLNFESTTSHGITVRATSSDGSISTANYTISLSDVDEFDVTVPTDFNPASNNINENVPIGTAVGITANAFDLDATTSTITYSLTSNPDNLFQIDPNTGVVTTAAAINREILSATRSITVQATSTDGSIASQVFSIAINDLDEFDVTVPTDSDAALNRVNENVPIGTTVGITANAFDLDATNSTITYSLTSNPDDLFQIDASTGIVTTAAAIGREIVGEQRLITVQAMSSDGSIASQTFSITINDLDAFDVTVPTDTNAIANVIDENVPIGTTVGITANAFDLDATNSTITYSLTSNPDNLFQIDPNTGVVTTAAAINREIVGANRSITVQASSTDGSIASQTFGIAINDLDEFDVTVPTDTDSASNIIDENVPVGNTVGITANAFDLDATTSTITYSLTSNPDNLFQIDPNTGAVTTAAAINREIVGANRSITVQASSTDGSVASKTFGIAINDLDEFDVTVPTDSDADLNEVNENVPIGTTVGITANAFDLDATTSTITYSLTSNPDGLFQIDPNTGVVTTAAAINREIVGANRSITVQASSTDGSVASQTFSIAINDLDEFDVTSITDGDSGLEAVLENASIGTVVGITVRAFDQDSTNSTINYSLDDSAGGRFAIDSVTGVVTVADSSRLDYESQTSHVIVTRATSSDGSTSTESFTISVAGVNERPIGVGEQYRADFVTPLTMNLADLLANDTDPENDALQIRILAFPSRGSVSLLGNGVFVYQPESNFVGTVTILYTVSDGSLESLPQTAQIVIERPPAIVVTPPADREIQKVVIEPQASSNAETPRVVAPIAAVEVNRSISAILLNESQEERPTVAAESMMFFEKDLSGLDIELDIPIAFEMNSDLSWEYRTQSITNLSMQRLYLQIDIPDVIDQGQHLFKRFVFPEERNYLEKRESDYFIRRASPIVVGTAIGAGISLHVLMTAHFGSSLLSQSGVFMPLDPLTILEGSAKVKKSKEREDLLFEGATVKGNAAQ